MAVMRNFRDVAVNVLIYVDFVASFDRSRRKLCFENTGIARYRFVTDVSVNLGPW